MAAPAPLGGVRNTTQLRIRQVAPFLGETAGCYARAVVGGGNAQLPVSSGSARKTEDPALGYVAGPSTLGLALVAQWPAGKAEVAVTRSTHLTLLLLLGHSDWRYAETGRLSVSVVKVHVHAIIFL